MSGMSWREFSYLINGLSGETPLGRIISIRAESDPEVLKEFTADEKKIRAEYAQKIAKKRSEKDVDNVLDNLKNAFMRMAK